MRLDILHDLKIKLWEITFSLEKLSILTETTRRLKKKKNDAHNVIFVLEL